MEGTEERRKDYSRKEDRNIKGKKGRKEGRKHRGWKEGREGARKDYSRKEDRNVKRRK